MPQKNPVGKLLSFQKPASNGYSRGYIFDKPRNNDFDKLVDRYALAERQHGLRANWTLFYSSRLKEYMFRPGQKTPDEKRFDVMKFLLGSAKEAGLKGEEYWVADIGAGRLKQWIWALAVIDNLRLVLTSLSDTDAHPLLKDKLHICAASELNLHLPKNRFQLVLSHYGTYYQQKDAFENIIHILEPDGSAIITSTRDEFGRNGPPPLEAPKDYGRFYRIVSFDDNGYDWMYWVKKSGTAGHLYK